MSKIQVSWKKENKQLDNDAEHNVQLKKQINKQSDFDSSIQNSINDKIYDLKQEAIVLAKKAENEKYKYMELQTIIKTIKLRMDDDRKLQASAVTDSNFENIETLERKIKKFQYDLQQISSKANKVNSVVSEKKHKISLLRTERVIDSSIFRNIEKQLISTEMEFKKLLIEKIKHQKIYEDCLKQYNSLKAKAQQYFQTQENQQKPQLTVRENIDQQSFIVGGGYNPNNKNKFKEIERAPAARNTIIQSELRKEEQNSYFEFRTKKLLMNLNLGNGRQFVYNWHNIDSINDKYFATLNSTSDQINLYEQAIKKIEKTINENRIKFYKPKSQLTKTQNQFLKCQQVKTQVQKINLSTNQQIKALNQFMDTQNFAQFARLVGLSDKVCPDMDLETLTDLLKTIESKMNQFNIYQAPKLPEENLVIKTSRTDKEKREQKLEDVMNRVKLHQQSDKIMRRQDFKEEYRKMMEAGPSVGSRQLLKKKTRKPVV